jgi:hypothetical protein
MFICRQQLGKQVSAELNTHTTIEELPCYAEARLTHLYNKRRIVRKWCFLLGSPRGYITRRTEGASLDGSRRWLRRNGNGLVEFRDVSLQEYELGSRTVELRHQYHWMQFSGVESLAVKRRLYVCYSTAMFGVSNSVTVLKSVATERLVETVTDWGH